MSKKSFYELVQPGMSPQLGSHTFTRDEIIAFAAKYDPQPFHLDDEAANNSLFGGLCASGWHTLSVWMGLNVKHGRKELVRLTGYDGPPLVTGPSPGVRNIRWTHPVYVGDTITFHSTILEKRESKSKPGWGILTNETVGVNQDGKQVVSFNGSVFLRVD